MTGGRASALRLGLAAAVLIALSLLLDRWAFQHLVYPPVHDHDWGRLLRSAGSLVFWAPLALAVWLESRIGQRDRAMRSWLLLLAPAVAGLAAEVLKILLRRERPRLHDGEWVFRSFADRPFSTSAIGLPSSHTMVAFAGAAILARLFPRAAPVAWGLATGCGLTRVLSRGHFLSDVAVGALAGWAVGALLWRQAERRAARNRSTDRNPDAALAS
ncbi:MAG TPA: phosphatase PAP2 family protein [Gemmatimonadales bacterium]|nr:phosphatase PAP2 family protein [Gemmatimonadales bacterium]